MANKYRWFTHDHDAHEDAWIRNLVRKQGHVGGWLWWVLIENLHRHGVGDVLHRDINDLSKAGLTSNSVLVRVLTEMATEFQGQTKVRWNLVGSQLELEIKKFREKQSKKKSNLPPTLPQPSFNLPQQYSTVQNNNNTTTRPAKKAGRPAGALSDNQKVVEAYKSAKGIPADDKAWNTANFPRNSKAAKALMDSAGGVDNALSYLKARGAYLTSKGMEWSLETIARNAADKSPVNDIRKSEPEPEFIPTFIPPEMRLDPE